MAANLIVFSGPRCAGPIVRATAYLLEERLPALIDVVVEEESLPAARVARQEALDRGLSTGR